MQSMRKIYFYNLDKYFGKEISNEQLKKIEKTVYETANDDDEYKKIAYEIVGEIHYIIKNHLSEKDEYVEKIISSIKENKRGWESHIYQKMKNKNMEEILASLQGEGKLEKCEFPCRNKKCRSDQCYIFCLQTRSGDEGFTNFLVCVKCGQRFKFS